MLWTLEDENPYTGYIHQYPRLSVSWLCCVPSLLTQVRESHRKRKPFLFLLLVSYGSCFRSHSTTMNFFQIPKVSQAEREVQPLLVDEGIQVLSSFEMNKIASLTYGDIVCDEIFELIEKILSHPLDFSPLTVEKTLVVTHHVIIYGSEKCVNSGYGMGRYIEYLTTFNSVLAAQQQQGVNAFFQRIQGGGVDRGGPIREAAQNVKALFRNIHELQRIRNESASKNSLVPIGNEEQIGFMTDEVRFQLLKQKIEEQYQIQIKSNLAKSEGGWGAGYMAKDGKNVVGAAHGIEEMIRMAQREKNKFTDAGIPFPTAEDKVLQELVAEAQRNKQQQQKQQEEEAARLAATQQQTVDLLGFTQSSLPRPTMTTTTTTTVDLLDFGTTNTTTTNTKTTTRSNVGPMSSSGGIGDLLGGLFSPAAPVGNSSSVKNDDLLGLSTPAPHGVPRSQIPQQSLLDLANDDPVVAVDHHNHDLLSLGRGPMSHMNDPFAAVGTTSSFESSSGSALGGVGTNGDIMVGGGGLMMNSASSSIFGLPSKAPVMAPTPQETDRFAALDVLASTNLTMLNSTPSFQSEMTKNNNNVSPIGGGMPSGEYTSTSTGGEGHESLLLLSSSSSFGGPLPSHSTMTPSLSLMQPHQQLQESMMMMMIAPTSGHVAAVYGDGKNDDDDNNNDHDNPWIMGGTIGTGLQPLGQAPAAPPPPPP